MIGEILTPGDGVESWLTSGALMVPVVLVFGLVGAVAMCAHWLRTAAARL